MEYSRFLQYPSLDVGAVIKYFMTHHGTSGKELAAKCGLPPQRISDFTNNRRRITAEISFAFENAFNIEHRGYFYLIQSNHDIYLADKKKRDAQTPDLNRISKHVFWDSNLTRVDWQQNRSHIIQRTFEYGDEQTIKEIIRFYGKKQVTEALSKISETRLADRRTLNAAKYL